jgi:hypothetical protein
MIGNTMADQGHNRRRGEGNSERERLLGHQVQVCPHCGRRHRFALLIGPRQEPLLFAGTQEVTVRLMCPRTRRTFEDRITIGSGEQFIRIADPFVDDDTSQVVNSAAAPDAELDEWMRSSRQTATEFCRTMLTASSAAIPVHFAVLQYLDSSGIQGSWAVRTAAVVPALSFLLATAAFALAQRPRLVNATTGAFAELRRDTLRRLDRLSRTGTALFLLGTAGSLIAFASLIVT